MKLKLSKWDPTTMKPHRKVLFIGRSGGGKSVAMRHVLYHMRERVDLAICFTPTEETRKSFETMVPPSCVHDALDLRVVDRALSMQKENVEKGKERSLLLVADDCAFDKGVWRTSTIRSAFFNSRHFQMGLVLSMQYLMDLSPDLRTNCDYIICTADNIHQNKKRLHQAFFGVFPHYADFDRAFSACTQDFSCCVLDQTQPNASIETSVFWWRASPALPPFRLCRPVLYKLHERPPAREAKEDVSVVVR